MSQRLNEALLQPARGPTDIFGVAYLQLCQISYALPSAIPGLVNTKMPPLSAGGRWACVWGPVESDDLANLVFVAAYYDGPNLPPTFAAVVTRGTDADVDDVWGVLQQAFEDFYVIFQRSPPWLPWGSPALVADGTLFALETIQGFSSGGVSVLDFVSNFLQAPENQNPLLVCTGHSLGGCVTSVLAPWLQSSLALVGVSNPIVPATFAAPTAGNAAFADYYTSTFSYCPRYYNTLDIAPLAWGNLDAFSTLYDGCNIPDSGRRLSAPRRLGGRHVGGGGELFPATIQRCAAARSLLRTLSGGLTRRPSCSTTPARICAFSAAPRSTSDQA
ncbi:MAG: lipase family protein, partial [Methylocystis sp.]